MGDFNQEDFSPDDFDTTMNRIGGKRMIKRGGWNPKQGFLYSDIISTNPIECSENLLQKIQAEASSLAGFEEWTGATLTLDSVLKKQGEMSINVITDALAGYEGIITLPTDVISANNVAASVEVYPIGSGLGGYIGIGELKSSDPTDLEWVLTPININPDGEWHKVETTKSKAYTGKYRIYIGNSAGVTSANFNVDEYMLNTGTEALTWCSPPI